MYDPPKRVMGQGSARVQRKFQILTYLEEAWDFGEVQERGWRTSGQIARAIEMKPSPHFRGLLDELLGEGVIEVRERGWRKNMVAYEWQISEVAYMHSTYAGAWWAYFGQ